MSTYETFHQQMLFEDLTHFTRMLHEDINLRDRLIRNDHASNVTTLPWIESEISAGQEYLRNVRIGKETV